MKIEIFDVENYEPDHLQAAVKCAYRYVEGTPHPELFSAKIYTTPRDASGWIEYAVSIFNGERRLITIGVLQRTPGAEIECHS